MWEQDEEEETMKIGKWIYLSVPVLLGAGMLLASQPKDKRVQPHQRIDFDYDSSWNGRPLTPGEHSTCSTAIGNIATPPPASITYHNAAGSTITVSCSTLAAHLRAQLDSGDIQAETTNTADGGEYRGEINVAGRHMARAGTTAAGMTFLEELLVHEETHKGAHQDTQTSDANEVEAYGAELAYKDSIGLDSASNGDYRDALSRRRTHQANYDFAEARRRSRIPIEDVMGRICFLDHGEGLNPDFFKSHGLTGGDYVYDLSPFLKASDMMLLLNYFMLPPQHSLALICGADPDLGHARMVGLDIYDGTVQPPEPYLMLDFPAPPYDPMFFYSMAYSKDMHRYYVVDTLNQRIVSMGDYDGDLIPDPEDLTIYASAFWPGFEPLFGMRSVEPTVHSHRGFGLIVNFEDAGYTHSIKTYDMRFFLPDADGDNVADGCLPVPRYEFITCMPHVAVPWAGESTIQVLATWEHAVAVWTSDSLGEDLYESLCDLWMVIPDMGCDLMRPLMAGEFIIAMDMENGRKLNLATKVIDPTPKELVLWLDSDGMLHLRWKEVPGASYYCIYKGLEPFEFPPEPTYYSETNEIVVPSADDKKFYRVTASKEGPME
jgi:hypothetical protein